MATMEGYIQELPSIWADPGSVDIMGIPCPDGKEDLRVQVKSGFEGR